MSEDDKMKFDLRNHSVKTLFSESVDLCNALRDKTDTISTGLLHAMESFFGSRILKWGKSRKILSTVRQFRFKK